MHADQEEDCCKVVYTQYNNSGNASDTKRPATGDSTHCGGVVHTALHLARHKQPQTDQNGTPHSHPDIIQKACTLDTQP